MQLGNKQFDFTTHTYIMGILNVTPDSFSDGGLCKNIDAALYRAEKMIQEGADIIDIGGESTRPGYTQISVMEEVERVVPVIEAVANHLDVPISIDTYKSQVAEAGLQAGAVLVNDIWGGKFDAKMAAVIERYQVAWCLMHNRNRELHPYPSSPYHSHSDQTYPNQTYPNPSFMQEILQDLQESIEIAKKAGIRDEKIIIDPGIGFGKTTDENLYIMNQLHQFSMWGYPVLLGTSRKSMIGNVLNVPVEERLEGTIATTVLGVMAGCGIVRVHDVLENKRAIAMTEAILRRGL